MLGRWSAAASRPVVPLINEIDSFIGDTHLSMLRQLRNCNPDRPRRFPQAVILCGVRDVCNYRIFSIADASKVSGGSAFNIEAEALRLGDFSKLEVRHVLCQHTAEKGQGFDLGAAGRIWARTHPRTALAGQRTGLSDPFPDWAGRDGSGPIGIAAIDRAKETLIRTKVTHLDELAIRLSDERVRRVVLPMLGDSANAGYSHRDLEYARSLGLVAA